MADLAKIILPSGDEYNFKDAQAREKIQSELDGETSTVTGDIVTFETESVQVLPSVVVDIDPVQDLHGYDHPWPAGGGKNLFPGWETVITKSASSYRIPVDFTSNTYYTVSGLDVNHAAWIFAYNNNNAIVGRTLGQYIAALTISKASFSYGDGTKDYDSISYIILQYYNWTDITRDAVEALPTQFEIGSSVTSFAPYSNICPISGLDGCIVERAGKNLFDKTQTMLTRHFINANGEIQAHNYYQVSDYIKVSPSTVYSFSGTITNDVTNAVAFFDSNKNFISRYLPEATNTPSRFTTPSNCAFIRFNWSNISSQLDTIQLEKGSTATQYEPYQNSTYSVSFPSSAGTVYGGTLDVTNGVLTVDRAMVDLGTLIWSYNSSYAFFQASLADAKNPLNRGGNSVGCCSIYRLASTPGTSIYNQLPDKSIAYCDIGYSSSPRVLVKDTSYLDAVTFKVAMSGVQLVYELDTPVTYQLTPTQITALLGQNNLWADTGDVSVVYREGKNALLKDVADAVHNLQHTYATKGELPAASSANPSMDGTAAPGISISWSRSDHVHPSDTSRVPITRTINGKSLNTNITLTAEDVGAQSATKSGTITFSLSWNTQPIEPGDEGHVSYEQIVTVTGVTITENSLISLQPTLSQLMMLMEYGVTAITIENDNGTLTAYALGATPRIAMTIACIVTEVTA